MENFQQNKDTLSMTKKESPKTKNRFEIAFDESIQHQIDLLMNQDEVLGSHKLLPKEARRKQLEHEIRASHDFSELGKHISEATEIIRLQGRNYLAEEDYITLINELNLLGQRLVTVDFKDFQQNFNEAFSLPASSRETIMQIGLAKFNEENLSQSLSIFTFLSELDFENADYFYRLGLIAFKNQEYEKALEALKKAASLAPDFIGIRIFAGECYLLTHQRDEALKELEVAKKLLISTSVDKVWEKCILNLESALM